MGDIHFNYIVTIHNSGFLLQRVLEGIHNSMRHEGHIYAVIDGCTDDSETVVDAMTKQYDLPVTKIRMPDLHEILSLNAALHRIYDKKDCDYVVTVQDDVVLQDGKFEDKVIAVYQKFPQLGHLSGFLGANLGAEPHLPIYNTIENICTTGDHGEKLQLGEFAWRQVICKSPSVIPFWLMERIGFLDEDLAPAHYDDVDYSLRTLKAGYENGILATKWQSEMHWGGTRRTDYVIIRRTDADVEETIERRQKGKRRIIKTIIQQMADNTKRILDRQQGGKRRATLGVAHAHQVAINARKVFEKHRKLLESFIVPENYKTKERIFDD